QDIGFRRAVQDFLILVEIEHGENRRGIQYRTILERKTIDAVLTLQPVANAYSIALGGDANQQILAIVADDDIVGMDAGLESHHPFEIVDRVLAIAKPEVVSIVDAAVLKLIVAGTAVEHVVLVRAEHLIIA